MIDHGQRVRLAGIVRGEVGYRHAAESYPLASDDDFRGVQCSKNAELYNHSVLLHYTESSNVPAGQTGLVDCPEPGGQLNYHRPDFVLR